MRRKEGTLLPIEISILEAGLELRSGRIKKFYGFLIAKELAERDGARKLTGYGTLYKALSRMETLALLSSDWEDPLTAAAESRPRRRLYFVTPAGEEALADAHAFRPIKALIRREGLVPS